MIMKSEDDGFVAKETGENNNIVDKNKQTYLQLFYIQVNKSLLVHVQEHFYGHVLC